MVDPTNKKAKYKRMEISDLTKEYGPPIKAKPTKSIRISTINLGGLRTDQFHNQLKQMDRLEIDIQGFCETNVNYNDYNIKRSFQKTLQVYHQESAMIMSTSETKCSSRFKPGGSKLIVVGQQTSRVKEKVADKLGRYLSLIHI